MIYLFIHQSFPGQYLHMVRHLAATPGNTVYFICRNAGADMPGVRKLVYRSSGTPGGCHPLTSDLDGAIRNGAAVLELCRELLRDGVMPDLIIGHSGWGETLFVKDAFPDTPVLSYFEFYYHASGVDLDFDPEFSSLFQSPENLRTRNGIALMAFDGCDWGQSPTQWQRSLLPPELRNRITVLHEGVDTAVVRPDPAARFEVPGTNLSLRREDEVVTYVSRNLEPYRGFHSFMRALPQIQKLRPKAQVLLVGADEVHYGRPAPPGTTYRELMLEEVGGALDLSRVHFLGKLRYEDYLRVLQVSSVHVYLTYPFMLSWSFVEAMASGCVIVGSSTPPVLEVLNEGENGLTVDFFSPDQIAERVDEVLSHPERMKALGQAARRTAVEQFDLHAQVLPRWNTLFADLVQGRLPDLNP